MLFRSFLGLASIATVANAIERRQSDDDYNWSRNDVLGLPDKVQAGEETIFQLNFTGATPRTIFNEVGYRKVQVLLSRYLDKDRSRAQVWCVIEPCVLPNVTSIRATIPKDAFPDDEDMRLKTRAFDPPGAGDPAALNYTAFISDHLDFELEGGDGEFSEWEKEHGWEILGRGLLTLPCDRVPCVRSCVEDHLDVDTGNSEHDQDNIDDFRECAAECGVRETPDAEAFAGECISENGERSSSNSSSTEHGGADRDQEDDNDDKSDGDSSNNNSDSDNDGDEGNGDEDSATRLGGVNTGWLLGGLVAWAFFAT